MTKPLFNYLLCFFAGSTLALSVAFGISHRPWALGPSGFIQLPELGDFVPFIGPVVLALAVVLISLTALAFYWGEAASPAARRPAARDARAAAHSANQPQATQADVGAVRDELERQLGRLIVLIAGQLENSKDHVASLKDTNTHLASVTSVTELREVVMSLIARNEANERQTRTLEVRLCEAQDQASVLRQRLTQAEKLASLDPLTSVANRRRFEQFISATVNTSHRDGTPLCLIMTDIDHFKKVNDTYGHSAGDRVLKSFAELLAKSVRGDDLVARYGGEEFAVVLPETPMGDAFDMAERIRKIFERQGGPDGRRVNEVGRLTASFGVAEVRDGEPPSALIQRADQMLYEAKNQGRNRTMIWSSSSGIPDDK